QVARLRSHQRGHLFACVLDQPPCGAALAMHRGWIALHLERGNRCGARRVAQRRGRVPVEIDVLGHGFRSVRCGGGGKPPARATPPPNPSFFSRTPTPKQPPPPPPPRGDAACQNLKWF